MKFRWFYSPIDCTNFIFPRQMRPGTALPYLLCVYITYLSGIRYDIFVFNKTHLHLHHRWMSNATRAQRKKLFGKNTEFLYFVIKRSANRKSCDFMSIFRRWMSQLGSWVNTPWNWGISFLDFERARPPPKYGQ